MAIPQFKHASHVARREVRLRKSQPISSAGIVPASLTRKEILPIAVRNVMQLKGMPTKRGWSLYENAAHPNRYVAKVQSPSPNGFVFETIAFYAASDEAAKTFSSPNCQLFCILAGPKQIFLSRRAAKINAAIESNGGATPKQFRNR